ncbi:hypothetical protein G6F32_016365 [Rhizopus arrhizus]|nr:hypothetical protein G6F32_016365 [Rhizopus arrhizus]
MPSACRMRAASTPSQVAAILIRIFSRGTPASAYLWMNWRALATVAVVSWAWSASTSMDTRPGTSVLSSAPTPMVRRSATACTTASRSPLCWRPQASSRSISSA